MLFILNGGIGNILNKGGNISQANLLKKVLPYTNISGGGAICVHLNI